MSYESAQLLNEYLLMHYGSDEQLMPWKLGPINGLHFPTRTVGHFPDTPCDTALDLGCATGRATFELSKSCNHVTGIDYSTSFIAAAEQIRTNGSTNYSIPETGNITTPATATRPEGARPDHITFLHGDAMMLPANLGPFDRVHAANLICRLSHPEKLLHRLPSLVRPGGHLALATPCTWLNQFTPPENQPTTDTLTWLQSLLTSHFNLLTRADEPFLIRETARKFQWTVSLVTLWQRHP